MLHMLIYIHKHIWPSVWIVKSLLSKRVFQTSSNSTEREIEAVRDVGSLVQWNEGGKKNHYGISPHLHAVLFLFDSFPAFVIWLKLHFVLHKRFKEQAKPYFTLDTSPRSVFMDAGALRWLTLPSASANVGNKCCITPSLNAVG